MTRKQIRRLRLILYALLLGALLLIPLDRVLSGSLCFWYNRTGLLCPACGATRALFLFSRLRFAEAYVFHPLFTLALYPLFFLTIAQDIYSIFRRKPQSLLEYGFDCLKGRRGAC